MLDQYLTFFYLLKVKENCSPQPGWEFKDSKGSYECHRVRSRTGMGHMLLTCYNTGISIINKEAGADVGYVKVVSIVGICENF